MKDVKELKHEVVAIGSLLGKRDIPIIFLNDILPIFKSPYGNYGGYKIQADLPVVIINAVLGYNGPTSLQLQYIRKGIKMDLIVGVDLQVGVLTGTTATKVIKEHDEYKVTNLHTMLAHDFTVGSDPEIFVENEGNLLPAFDFLGSKKARENKTPEGLPVYWDGFQAEFETQFNSCLEVQTASVSNGLITTIQSARKKFPKAKLSAKTVMGIPSELLASSKEEHVSLGCMPSYNAYGLSGKVVSDPRQLPFRSTGGHIHLGIKGLKKEDYIKMVKGMDAVMGVACVSLFKLFDNPARREMYGLAGEYRLPPHGVEWRTLSNAWMFHPLIMQLVFDIARKAAMLGRTDMLKLWQATEKETIECINSCDVAKAQEILNRNKPLFMKLVEAAYNHSSKQDQEAVFNVFINGMESLIKDPTDIEGNWGMSSGVSTRNKQYRYMKNEVTKGSKVA